MEHVDSDFESSRQSKLIWYSDRLASGYQNLVDESADSLEDEVGVLDLGQIDHKILMADGLLTDEVKKRPDRLVGAAGGGLDFE